MARSSRLSQQSSQLCWQVNGAGIAVSHSFGFGVLDCARAVRLAKAWTNVGVLCVAESTWGEEIGEIAFKSYDDNQLYVPFEWPIFKKEMLQVVNKKPFITRHHTSTIIFDLVSLRGKQMFSHQQQDEASKLDGDCEPESLEQVVLTIQIVHPCRGALTVWMESPQGTVAVLLFSRPKDTYTGLFKLRLKSYHFWEEVPDGRWLVHVTDAGECNPSVFVDDQAGEARGFVQFAKLHFYGSSRESNGWHRNKQLLYPLESRVSKKVKSTRRAKILTKVEIEEIRDETKWWSLHEKPPPL
ncbi:proprotein convertase subtilisin kexin type [Cichlidogyrus casuarinus]|uniref:Proprotein convertase subtilisin kexin type n=1 Tax=Cichlidogyrus casuarinus TaxID=1844966 RepID=A0ABD2Q548_9PLAT